MDVTYISDQLVNKSNNVIVNVINVSTQCYFQTNQLHEFIIFKGGALLSLPTVLQWAAMLERQRGTLSDFGRVTRWVFFKLSDFGRVTRCFSSD